MSGIILQTIKQIFGEEEARVIAQALPAFIGAVLAGALLFSTVIAFALRCRWKGVVGHKDARIEALEERVRLGDDQLSNKLQTTPPDEARQMIDALQAQISRLAPRRVPETARSAILESGALNSRGMPRPQMPKYLRVISMHCFVKLDGTWARAASLIAVCWRVQR
jgi:hypothetical protein